METKMPKAWATLEGRLKSIEKKSLGVSSEPEEHPPPKNAGKESKGSFTEYMEHVQSTFKGARSGHLKQKYSSLSDKLDKDLDRLAKDSSASADSSLKPDKKGEFSEYIKRVKAGYKNSSSGSSGPKDKYESMFKKIESPNLKKDEGDESSKHFKGMEKRFLRSR